MVKRYLYTLVVLALSGAGVGAQVVVDVDAAAAPSPSPPRRYVMGSEVVHRAGLGAPLGEGLPEAAALPPASVGAAPVPAGEPVPVGEPLPQTQWAAPAPAGDLHAAHATPGCASCQVALGGDHPGAYGDGGHGAAAHRFWEWLTYHPRYVRLGVKYAHCSCWVPNQREPFPYIWYRNCHECGQPYHYKPLVVPYVPTPPATAPGYHPVVARGPGVPPPAPTVPAATPGHEGGVMPAPGGVMPAPGGIVPAPGEMIPPPGDLVPSTGQVMPSTGVGSRPTPVFPVVRTARQPAAPRPILGR